MRFTRSHFIIPVFLFLMNCLPTGGTPEGVLDLINIRALQIHEQVRNQGIGGAQNLSIVALSGRLTDGSGDALDQVELSLKDSSGTVRADVALTDSGGRWILDFTPVADVEYLVLSFVRGGQSLGSYSVEVFLDPTSTATSVRLERTGGSAQLTVSGTRNPRLNVSDLSLVHDEGSSSVMKLSYAQYLPADMLIRVTSSSPSLTVNDASSLDLLIRREESYIERFISLSFKYDENLVDDKIDITISTPGHADQVFTLNVIDQDTQSIVVINSNQSVVEGGNIVAQVRLNKKPETSVDVDIVSNDPGALAVDVSTLTFTPSNYNTPRNIQLDGIQDPGLTDEFPRIGFSIATMPEVTPVHLDLRVQDDEVPHSVALTGETAGGSPRVLAIEGKLVLLTERGYGLNTGATLTVCELDGSSCVERQSWAGSGYRPDFVWDAVNRKILIAVSRDDLNLYRCSPDGITCSQHTIIPGGSYYLDVSLAIDHVNGKILAAYDETSNASKLGFVRCNLDGTGCTIHDITAGEGVNTGREPRLQVDAANGKFVVVTYSKKGSDHNAVFRCDLDGTGCVYTNLTQLSGGLFLNNFFDAYIDGNRGRLMITGESGRLMDCALDLNECSSMLIPGTGQNTMEIMGTVDNKMIITSSDFWNTSTPLPLSFMRCDPDGSDCVQLTRPEWAGILTMRVGRDDLNGNFLLVGNDERNNSTARLYIVPYNFAD